MISENSEIFDANDSTEIGFISFLDMRQNGDFNESLLNKFWRFFSDFQS